MAHWTGRAADLSLFLGTPVMALAVGAGLAILQLFTARKGELFLIMYKTSLPSICVFDKLWYNDKLSDKLVICICCQGKTKGVI